MGFVARLLDILRPRWRHSDWKVRVQAVKKVYNQALLAKIAANDQVWQVRTAAVRKLTIPSTLRAIAAGDQPEEVRVLAAKRIQALVLGSSQYLRRFINSGGNMPNWAWARAKAEATNLGALGYEGSTEILIQMLTWVLPLISLSEYLANVPPTNPLSGEAKLEASKKLPQLLEFARAVIGALGQLADERANDILLALRDGQVTQLLVKHQDPNVRCFLLRTSAGEDGTDRQLHPSLRATVTKAIKRVSRISAT